MTWSEFHPAFNAGLNATSGLFLIAGLVAIRNKNTGRHRNCMIAAFTCSSVFLMSYVVRYILAGTHRYPGDGWDKVLYLSILFSHMVLATVLVPMVLRTLHLAWTEQLSKHRRLARWTLPIWLYVSVTGVIVYVMLYPIGGAHRL